MTEDPNGPSSAGCAAKARLSRVVCQPWAQRRVIAFLTALLGLQPAALLALAFDDHVPSGKRTFGRDGAIATSASFDAAEAVAATTPTVKGSGLDSIVLQVEQPCPTIIGRWGHGLARSVTTTATHAFICNGTVLEIAERVPDGVPRPVGEVLLPELLSDVVVAGNTAYVHGYVQGRATSLFLVDVSDPGSPSVVGTHESPVLAVATDGHFAYIARGGSSAGLDVLDVADPPTPVRVASLDGIPALRMALSGDTLYVAGMYSTLLGYSALYVVDVSDPLDPRVTGECVDCSGADVAVSDGFAYVVARGRVGVLRVVDVSDGNDPFEVSSLPLHDRPEAVAVSGQHVFVAGRDATHIVSVPDPAWPVEIGRVDLPQPATDVSIDSDQLLIACERAAVRVVDTTDPTVPHEVGIYRTAGNTVDMAVVETRAHAVDESGNLWVLDLSDLQHPITVGYLRTGGSSSAVARLEDSLVVANGRPGLLVIDIAEPGAPTVLAQVDTENALDVVVSGDHALVADDTGGLVIVDIADRARPAVAATFDAPGKALAVATSHDLAYLADDHGSLSIIDVTNPAAPCLVGVEDSLVGELWDVDVSGDVAYVVEVWIDWHTAPCPNWAEYPCEGVAVIDISDPTQPRIVGFHEVVLYRVTAAGHHLLLSDGDGASVASVSASGQLAVLGQYATTGWPSRITTVGRYALHANGPAGMSILDLAGCSPSFIPPRRPGGRVRP